LVDETSATLDIVLKPLPLDRPHVLTNKFSGPGCADYQKVAGKIQEFLGKIRQGTALVQADAWIRDKHYTAARLEIETLSGHVLSMDQCYINLAIIEQHRSKGASETQSSPFSLSARLKVEMPDQDIQVELPPLFAPRKRGGVETKPRRILIRGRAGVGKTTLCKKIVHEFTRGTWCQWNELFDRILWVPLRNLKLEERRQAGYHFVHLFSHEYFSSPPRPDLASALAETLEGTKSSRNLFLLDGLDEVSQDLGNESSMFRFLKDLLNQPNVIITSRPSGKLPLGLDAIDMELETIGFYPDQVSEYLERVLPSQVEEIQSFLQDRPLVQDLVRIPIQLDAFGFTWNESFSTPTKLGTMTAVYQAIEDGLWRKDVLRLGKRYEGKLLTEGLVQDCHPSEIQDLVKNEICLLEGFAFTGLHNDVIDFESRHQRAISTNFSPTIGLAAKTLARLSFLRAADLSPKRKGNQSYHFLHLTYQEYFAARYFVRQWQAGEPLKCLALGNEKLEEMGTGSFLRKHKYTARYDIFWRFVAGLLDAKGNAEGFFKATEDKPRDLLGPTHQRLVMHCLSETSTEMPLRRSLEEGLKEWLLFECDFTKEARLAGEAEFLERVLSDALREESDVWMTILRSVAKRPTLPSSVVNMICSWLEGDESNVSKTEVLDILLCMWFCQGALPNRLLAAVVGLIHNSGSVGSLALQILKKQPSISDERLTAVLAVALCQNKDRFVRESAFGVLQAHPRISDGQFTALLEVVLCRHEDRAVREAALQVLRVRPSISDEHLTALAALVLCRDEHWTVRAAALEVLRLQPSISDENLTAVLGVVLCKDEDCVFRQAALTSLHAQCSASDERLTAAAVEVVLCRDEHWTVRAAALEVLRPQPSISDETLTAVLEVVLCKDEDYTFRQAALTFVHAQCSASDERLTAAALEVVLCKDEDWAVRQTALLVLQARCCASDERLRLAVIALLRDENGEVRWAALGVLQERPSIFDEHLLVVTALRLCNDVHSLVRENALKILQAQPSVSDERLPVAMALLKDKNWAVRQAAFGVLQAQPSLSDEYCTAVVALLEDGNKSVKRDALYFLGARPSLSDEHRKAVVAALLEDGDPFVRIGALRVLQAHPRISDERVIAAVVPLLEDEKEDVRRAAVEFLQAQPSISDEHLTGLSRLLDSERAGGLAEAVLRGYKEFYSTLLEGPSAEALLKILFPRSFEEQWSLYVEDGVSYLNTPDGVRQASVDDVEGFMDTVRKSLPPGIPSMAAEV
jgi:HEAT repeat protein